MSDSITSINHKTDRINDEFLHLDEHNVPLEELVWDVASYCKKQFNKDITITMIWRHQTEQDDIYKDNEQYQIQEFKSPHQFWQAVDLRSSIFTEEEIDDIVKYLNDKYNESNYYKWTAKNHNVGRGDHFHIQYYKVG